MNFHVFFIKKWCPNLTVEAVETVSSSTRFLFDCDFLGSGSLFFAVTVVLELLTLRPGVLFPFSAEGTFWLAEGLSTSCWLREGIFSVLHVAA